MAEVGQNSFVLGVIKVAKTLPEADDTVKFTLDCSQMAHIKLHKMGCGWRFSPCSNQSRSVPINAHYPVSQPGKRAANTSRPAGRVKYPLVFRQGKIAGYEGYFLGSKWTCFKKILEPRPGILI
jgi:hypothetical protein